MKNPLLEIKKDLKSFIKRSKNLTYSTGLAILCLMVGNTAFGKQELESLTRKDIGQSLLSIQNQISNLRKENDKTLDPLRLSYIQLMEQGEQVIKSPWESWQIGINYFYERMYKGGYHPKGEIFPRRSKIEKDSILARDIFLSETRYLPHNYSSYGLTTLFIPKEEATNIKIPVVIQPKTISKNIDVVGFEEMKISYVDVKDLPSKAIVVPKVEEPNSITPPSISFAGAWINGVAGNYADWLIRDTISTDGNLYQASAESGHILKRKGLTNKIYLKDYEKGTWYYRNRNKGGDPPRDAEEGLADGVSFFYSLEDVPYSYFGKNMNASFIHEGNLALPNFIHFETEGSPRQKFDKLKEDGVISTEQFDEIRGYTERARFTHNGNGELYHVNHGNVELGGKNTRYVQTTFAGGHSNRISLLENRGNIVSMNYEEGSITSSKNVIYLGSRDTGGTGQHIYANHKDGNIEMHAEGAVVMAFTADGRLLEGSDISYINDGKASLFGRVGTGIFVAGDEKGKLSEKSNFMMSSPMYIHGDRSTGLYVLNSGKGTKNSINEVRFVIGNQNPNSVVAYIPKNHFINPTYSLQAKHNMNSGDSNWTEESIGVYLNNPVGNLVTKLPQLDIEKFSKASVGVYSKNGTVNIKDGNLKLRGGEKNIGLFSEGGKINYEGDLTLTTSTDTSEGGNTQGKGNIGIFAKKDGANIGQIDFHGNLKTEEDRRLSEDGIGIYSNEASVNVYGAVDMKLRATDTGTSTGVYAKGENSFVKFHNPQQVSIEVLGKTVDGKETGTGVSLFAENKGIIESQGITVKGMKSSSIAGAKGVGAKVDLRNANIEYNGQGYVFYTEQGGEVDARFSNIALGGSAVLLDRDINNPLPLVQLNNANVEVFSNDVTIMNLKNVQQFHLSTLNQDINAMTGGIIHRAGTKDGVVYDKYKLARVENVLFDVDTNLDRSKAVNLSDENTNDYSWVRRLRAKRSQIVTKPNIEIQSFLSESDLEKMGESNHVVLSMSSNENARQLDETKIHLQAGSLLKADTTTGISKGGIGAYINHGIVQVDAGSEIQIEKESSNPANESGVGIYAINGSKVMQDGKLSINGKAGIGILGLSYRKDEIGKSLENEFGPSVVGQGTIEITNKGIIVNEGETGVGIYVNNNNKHSDGSNHLIKNEGEISVTGNRGIGISANRASIQNTGKISVNPKQEGIGMLLKTSSYRNPTTGQEELASLTLANEGEILLAEADTNKANIGMYANQSEVKVVNKGKIKALGNSYGIYGKDILLSSTGEIQAEKNSIGILSIGDSITLEANSKLQIGSGESVGVFSQGSNTKIEDQGANIDVGDSSYGFVLKGKETEFVNQSGNTSLGNGAVYLYSEDEKADIKNNMNLNSVGDHVYGIYGSGKIENKGNMDFSEGKSSIGIFLTKEGKVINAGTIKVAGSDVENNLYGIGLAGISSTNNITLVNKGTIEVKQKNGIGIYAKGRNTFAKNEGTINLGSDGVIGMYLDDHAVGENYGLIQTTSSNLKGVKGVILNEGGTLKNYGRIVISGSGNVAIKSSEGILETEEVGLEVSQGAEKIATFKNEFKDKTVESVTIGEKKGKVVITQSGKELKPAELDVIPPTGEEVQVGNFVENISTEEARRYASTLGMYVDTSGVKFTNPIEGIENLPDTKAELIIGTEATQYTTEKSIKLGKNILSKYDEAMKEDIQNRKQKNLDDREWALTSAGLHWIAHAKVEKGLDEVYLAKIPYTDFAKGQKKDEYHFLNGLEQRYGAEKLGSRENILFQKLNGIRKGEPYLFSQAVEEMKGYQYATIQQRIHSTGRILEKEFRYLRKEWENVSKDSNKIKAFGMSGEYTNDTFGNIDYKNYAQGLAYVHEDEAVKLGVSKGWYTGFVRNEFQFDDFGKSKEEIYQGKLGYFRNYAFDNNGSLQWTVSFEGFLGRSKMHRKYLVVDDVFQAKSRYWSYGFGLKNELTKEIRLSEGIKVKPYGSLNLEYGRITKIQEKTGEMRLDIKANDYYSVRPELGVEFVHRITSTNGNLLQTSIGIAYENELGQVQKGKNIAKVSYTTADYYHLPSVKGKEGNIKVDLNVGFNTSSYGLTANAGYDSKGRKMRFGMGVRVIF